MERKYFKEQLILRLYVYAAFALLLMGVVAYFTSPLTNILRGREDTPINFLVLTKPAMFISYNPSTRKGFITNLSEEESALSPQDLLKDIDGNTPYIFIPLQTSRQIFWNNFKQDLSLWRKRPYIVFDYVYSYIKMRIQHKTFISVGDFLLLSLELPYLSGVDFTVKETPKPKKVSKSSKVKPSPVLNVALPTQKEEEDTILVVEVFNASDKNGLAVEVTRYLRTLNNKGIFKVDVINYSTSSQKQEHTQIMDLSGRAQCLKDLSTHLGITDKEIFYLEDKNAISDARIFLGEDFELPKGYK